MQLSFPSVSDKIYSNPAEAGFPVPTEAFLRRPGARGAGGWPPPTHLPLPPSFKTKAVALGHAKWGNTPGGDTSEQAACSKHWALGPDQPVVLWAQQPLANVETSAVWVMYSCLGFIKTKMCQQASCK